MTPHQGLCRIQNYIWKHCPILYKFFMLLKLMIYFVGQISFSARILTYFVNDDIKAGKELVSLEVKVKSSTSPVTYAIVPVRSAIRVRQILKIDRLKGKITLRRNLKRFLRRRKDGTRRVSFKVIACQGKKKHCARVFVRIIALRANFGDQFVEEALKHVTAEKIVNHIYKGITRKTITPSFLLRVLRRIPKSSEDIAMLDAKQEMLLDYVRRKIVKVLSLRKL